VARPARFSSEQILRAALHRITGEGPASATISGIAADIGAPTGSLYHRFPSRDVLVATLWLDVVENFQAGFLAALDDPNAVDGGRQALGFALDWCRKHPPEARLLLLHRREDLLAEGIPSELQDRARVLGENAERGVRSYAKRRCGSLSSASLRRVRFALIDVPFAAVRRDLESGSSPSREVDDLVFTVYDAVFAASGSPRSAARGLRSK
jgi:AcrR family transcriptional regulator